jgi:hypothetical protein
MDIVVISNYSELSNFVSNIHRYDCNKAVIHVVDSISQDISKTYNALHKYNRDKTKSAAGALSGLGGIAAVAVGLATGGVGLFVAAIAGGTAIGISSNLALEQLNAYQALPYAEEVLGLYKNGFRLVSNNKSLVVISKSAQ